MQVVAGTTMPRSVTHGSPERSTRDPAEQGSGSGGDARPRQSITWGANSPLRGRIFLWKKLLHPTRSRPISPQSGWDGALRAVCFVRLLAKERPRAQPEGPCEAGIGQRRGCQDRAKNLLGRLHPAAGSHLPLEETAPPFVVVPFALSPFAHPIPQSHRRASGDLFSASPEIFKPESALPWKICPRAGQNLSGVQSFWKPILLLQEEQS
jgi:hypothetical protein